MELIYLNYPGVRFVIRCKLLKHVRIYNNIGKTSKVPNLNGTMTSKTILKQVYTVCVFMNKVVRLFYFLQPLVYHHLKASIKNLHF